MRGVLKRAVFGLATAAVAPLLLSYAIRARLMGPNRALEGSTQLLAGIPGFTGQFLRRAFLHRALAHCDPSATIEYGTIFSQAGARIERNAYIGPRCHVGLAHIGEDVLIGAGVHIPSGGATHDFSDLSVPIRLQSHHRSCVSIGAGAWVGSGAIVMADVGANTVVGAGSVVTRPQPEAAVVAGSPAKVIRLRTAKATA